MRSLVVCICLFSQISFAQKPDSTRAFHIALGSEIVLYSITMYALNDLWYKDYPKSSFHWINDNSNWLQIDKMGHFTSAYHSGLVGMDLYNRFDNDKKKSIIKVQPI